MAKTRTATPKKKAPARKTSPRSAAKARPAAEKKARPAPAENEPARQNALYIAQLGLEKKAGDVVVLDVRGLSSYADYFVVMTAESDPQLTAIADHVEQKMKERGERPIGIEGTQAGQWVLIDFADVVAHVFYQDMRQFYDIEGLWADAKRIPIRD